MNVFKSTMLFGLFILLAGFGDPLPAEEQKCFPSEYACPVTPNLFPELEKTADALRYIFPENALEFPINKVGDIKSVARRISIALVTADRKDCEVVFKWIGAVFAGIRDSPRIDWGVHSGILVVKGDGNPHCFFLGSSAGLPSNTPCKEFDLTLPPGVEIKQVSFSNLGGEYVSRNCPMPELEKEINSAYVDSRLTPQDDAKASLFLHLLEKAIPKYDCVGKGGGKPVPAWWLVNRQTQDNWRLYVYDKVEENNKLAFKVFVELLDTAGAHAGEMMCEVTWKMLHDRPLFILECWESVREYRERILECRWLESPESNIKMIKVYREIGLNEPKHKPACDEIIEILQKKIPEL